MVQYDLASNSFLNHAAKNLPSTMLGWHYRSRSESLDQLLQLGVLRRPTADRPRRTPSAARPPADTHRPAERGRVGG